MDLMWIKGPLWDAANEGGGGAGGAADGAEGAQADEGGEGGAATTDWRDGLGDDQKAFVGDRDLGDFIDYAKSQRDAAGRRATEVAEAEGLIKPVAAGDEAGDFFARFKPETAEAYGETIGRAGDSLSAEDKINMEAAHAADLHPDQYRRLHEKTAELRETADKASAEKMVTDLKTEWGPDFERNGQSVDRAAKALGFAEDSAFMKALSNPGMGATPADYRAIMEGLRTIGENMKEGSGPGAGDGVAEGQTAAEKLAALEGEIVDAGGKKTPDQERRLAELQNAAAMERKAA
ncbi:MAG: hypothetical protein AAFQ58_19210 [Pseudomonadota bacterium]